MKGNIPAAGAGTHQSQMAAAHIVETIETRKGYKIVCLEEITFNQSWLSSARISENGRSLSNTHCGKYFLNLLKK
jgi:glucose-1-phosphate thymidylyltransferase